MWHAPAIYWALIERRLCTWNFGRSIFSIAYNLGQLGRWEIEDYRNEPLITIVCGRILKATLESRFKRIGAASPAKGPL